MKSFLTYLDYRESLGKAVCSALLAGIVTSIIVLTMQPSHNNTVWLVGNHISKEGNDLFLILSNFLIIFWAWRKRLFSIIKMTLWLDFYVWLIVQGLKFLHVGPYLRPNGHPGGFPSGHATHAFGMAFLLTLYFPRFSWLWYSCAAVISWSRVETDWHTGFQVTAGIVIGLALVVVLVTRWLSHPDAAIIRPITAEEQKVSLRSYAAE